MKKAIIVYQSKTGTTRKYAKQISAYLQTKQIESTLIHVGDYKEELLQDADYLLTGCWTHGLMVLFQRPDKVWIEATKKVSVPAGTRVALFATYKILTGSMFRKMAKFLKYTGSSPVPNLKSRDGSLSEQDRGILDEFIA